MGRINAHAAGRNIDTVVGVCCAVSHTAAQHGAGFKNQNRQGYAGPLEQMPGQRSATEAAADNGYDIGRLRAHGQAA